MRGRVRARGRTARAATSRCGGRGRAAARALRRRPGRRGRPTSPAARGRGARRARVQEPLAVRDVQRLVRADLDAPGAAAGRLEPRVGDVRMADDTERCALGGEAGRGVGGADELPDGVARAAVPALDAVAPRRRLARAQPRDGLGREPLARQFDRAHSGGARFAEPVEVDRSGRAVVVVPDERDGAAVAGQRDRALGVRAAADHVAERPQLRGAEAAAARITASSASACA